MAADSKSAECGSIPYWSANLLCDHGVKPDCRSGKCSVRVRGGAPIDGVRSEINRLTQVPGWCPGSPAYCTREAHEDVRRPDKPKVAGSNPAARTTSVCSSEVERHVEGVRVGGSIPSGPANSRCGREARRSAATRVTSVQLRPACPDFCGIVQRQNGRLITVSPLVRVQLPQPYPGCSSVGRAPSLGLGGRTFKPCHLDHTSGR